MKTRLKKLLAMALSLTLLLSLVPLAGAVVLDGNTDYRGTLKVGDVFSGGDTIAYYLRDRAGNIFGRDDPEALLFASESDRYPLSAMEPDYQSRHLFHFYTVTVAGDDKTYYYIENASHLQKTVTETSGEDTTETTYYVLFDRDDTSGIPLYSAVGWCDISSYDENNKCTILTDEAATPLGLSTKAALKDAYSNIDYHSTNDVYNYTLTLPTWAEQWKVFAIEKATSSNNGIVSLVAIGLKDSQLPWTMYADTDWYEESKSSYTLSTAAELAGLAQLVNDEGDSFAGITITLGRDIDLSGHTWDPIGTNLDTGIFSGTFNGGGHTIRNMRAEGAVAGLFGMLGGTVMNVKLDASCTVSGSMAGGGIAGGAMDATIVNCSNAGTVTTVGTASDEGGFAVTGGMAGMASGGIITGCSNEGTITAQGDDSGDGLSAKAGGIAGGANSTTITNSFNTGAVSATKFQPSAGGIVGELGDYASIGNCYNRGSITANGVSSMVGGIVGSTGESATLPDNCYSTGRVNAAAEDAKAGGIIGWCGVYHDEVSLSNCHILSGTVKDDAFVGGYDTENSDIDTTACTLFSNSQGDIATLATALNSRAGVVNGADPGAYNSWVVKGGVNGGFPALLAAVPTPTVSVDQKTILANGAPLQMVAGSEQGKTNIRYDKDGNGTIGDTEYLQIGDSAPTAAGYDLSAYTIFGGGEKQYIGDTSVTMTGGAVKFISGGGDGADGKVIGTAFIRITGGTVSGDIFGGDIVGGTKLTVGGGAQIGTDAENPSDDCGIRLNDGWDITDCVDSFAISPALTGGDGSILVVLSEDYDTSTPQTIATGAVAGDLAKIKLVGAVPEGGMTVFSSMDNTIKVRVSGAADKLIADLNTMQSGAAQLGDDGVCVKLNRSITLTGEITIEDDLTLDLGGCSITGKSDTSDHGEGLAGLTIENGAEVTVTGSGSIIGGSGNGETGTGGNGVKGNVLVRDNVRIIGGSGSTGASGVSGDAMLGGSAAITGGKNADGTIAKAVDGDVYAEASNVKLYGGDSENAIDQEIPSGEGRDYKFIRAETVSAITKANATNGSFTVQVAGSPVTKAAAGATVTVMPTANPGYVVDTISVTKTAKPYTTVTVSGNSFLMPAYGVTVSVSFRSDPGSSGGGDSGSGDSGDSGGNSNVVVTPPPKDAPNAPTEIEIKVPGKVDADGSASATVTDQVVRDAIRQAEELAKKNGNAGNGMTLTFHVDTGSKPANTVSVNLPKTTQEIILNNRIASTVLMVDNPDIQIGIDLAAVDAINGQAKSDVSISATRVDNATLTGEGKAAVGNRPVFDLTVSYKDGAQLITGFGNGLISASFPYTLQAGELPAGLYAAYLKPSGEVQRVSGSRYDAVGKRLNFTSNHLSVYGVAYKEPAALTDIADHWAKADILFVAGRGLMNGTTETTFSPNGSMTRGMFVTALGRLAGVDTNRYPTSNFTDVKAGIYYAPYVAWATEQGITNGTTATTFSPNKIVSRQEMAAFMSRFAQAMGYAVPQTRETVTFADSSSIGSWAAEAVQQMQMAGILNGKSGNRFDPAGTATRGEIAAVLHRYVELVVDPALAR